MALKGFGAVPLSERKANKRGRAVSDLSDVLRAASQGDKRGLPWWAEGLSRSERVIVFCEALRCTSGTEAGKNLRLRDWQKDFINRVYAVDEKGNRPIRSAILSMGRKNGKTQLAAALALCHLVGPEVESRGEVYSCANDRFQASKIFYEMVALLQGHPYLNDRCNIQRFLKTIEDLESGSFYTALTAEAKTKMGLNPSLVVYDELGQAGDRTLYDAMDSALGARKEPLMLIISTQAADDNAPMSNLIDYGLRVNSGEIVDPRFHLTFHAAPLSADPWDRKSWELANPALGDFRSLDDVERQAGQAQRMPAQESAFRNLILNQRVSAEARFIERSQWQTCDKAPMIPDGAQVYAGLDLGATRDMSALVLVYPDPFDGAFHVQPYFWLPGDVLERTEKDKAPYDVWVREGLVTSSGVTTDPADIAQAIADLSVQYRIQKLAYDRWRIADLQRELTAIGCDVPIAPHGQGFKEMSGAVDIVERLVVQKRLRHGGNPVLQMCAANAVITRDPAGNRKFNKARSSGRIDGLVALAMALSCGLILKEADVDIRSLIG